jgi:hypothetical protein
MITTIARLKPLNTNQSRRLSWSSARRRRVHLPSNSLDDSACDNTWRLELALP